MRSMTYIIPQLVLVAGSIFVLLSGLVTRSRIFFLVGTIVPLVIAGLLYSGMAHRAPQEAFNGLIVLDPFGVFFAIFAIVVLIIGSLTGVNSREIRSDRVSEFYSILLALGSGLVFMGISNHFLMIYLSIETVSILSYTLAGFHRERSASVEASLKYVVYGSMASALMVFGMSLLYGVSGHLSISGLRQYILSTPPGEIPQMMWVGALLVFGGIGYKISAAPMHMWTPDVYEGAPTPVSAIFSVAPKAAGFALLIRFFVSGFSLPVSQGSALVAASSDPAMIGYHVLAAFNWPKLLMLSSIFTMFMGNLAALGQVSVKRILAYSSIAHAGYMLMGVTTQTGIGLQAILFYVIAYCFMNLGAFWIASQVEDTYGGDLLRHFRGLVQRQPFHAVAMAIFLFSLVGLPPFSGFIGKLYLFSAIIAREMYGYALLAALNSVIALAYYIKIIKAMFLEAPEVKEIPGPSAFTSKLSFVLLFALVIPNIVLGLYWEPVMKVAEGAIRFFAGS